VAVLILGPVGIFLAQRFKLIDHPGLQEHKKHQFPIPLAGGLILGIALIFLLPLFKLWKLSWVLQPSLSQQPLFSRLACWTIIIKNFPLV
jgi:UDP-N-acetylmuramyl pentapeptide phosphotransferase/UDP-N-acetylglucosamine-1-phosphate transferase